MLNALELKCNNTACRPVMDAIDLLKRCLDQPIGVREEWRKAVVDERGRVERIPYELCVLVALRDALLRREIRVPGANRWQNPEDDLPPDFEDYRGVHDDAIRQPQDPQNFIEALDTGQLSCSRAGMSPRVARRSVRCLARVGGLGVVGRRGPLDAVVDGGPAGQQVQSVLRG